MEPVRVWESRDPEIETYDFCHATTDLLDTIAAVGANPNQILGTLGLERSVFSDPAGFIASSTFTRILDEAAGATGDACFGLHFGEHFNLRDWGTLV